MTVLIIGAGIGGLTTALSLHQVGIPCQVFESAGRIEPLGVGINTLPHAVRELTELGLLDELTAAGITTSCLAYYSKHGNSIWSEARGRLAGYNWPQISIHRGTLQQILYNAVLERLGPDAIKTAHHLESWNETDSRVTAHFVNRETGAGAGSYDGQVLIAADGIHSTVRTHHYPNEGPPIWNGAILWRGVTDAAPYLDGSTMIMAGHEFQKFVCYPIAKRDNGEMLINWIAERKFPADHAWRREDWNRPGNPDDFLPQFESWTFDWLDIPQLIKDASICYEFPMVDRDPLEKWTYGRTTLLGDAAHAMYPIGSNGASQAILDARVLTQNLKTHGVNSAALLAYETERKPATAKIVLANRQNGPEQVMQLVERRAPDGFDKIEDVLSTDELESTAANYKRLAGFDKDTLNSRPPLVR